MIDEIDQIIVTMIDHDLIVSITNHTSESVKVLLTLIPHLAIIYGNENIS